MELKYFDAHTHIHFPAYDADRDAVMSREKEVCVGMITVGTREDTSESAVRFAEMNKNVWVSVGLHPNHTIELFHDEDELGKLFANSRELANGGGFVNYGRTFNSEFFAEIVKSEKVVAIGECGLDYYRLSEDEKEREEQKNKQKEEFIKQIRFAGETKKPLMIHCRDAYRDLIEILNLKREILNFSPGIIHFFSGSDEEAKKLLDMGFFFTFGGTITFPQKKNGIDYAEIAKMIPLEKILSETDAPWVAPAPYRGKRNEPAYVVEVVKKLAEIKNIPIEVMREQILENVKNAFGIEF